ncbi:MAG: hypothetical protein IJU72_00440 [Bacteroidales bacterium]|nr:hypothetical protein [Bacteroidales bacterium]
MNTETTLYILLGAIYIAVQLVRRVINTKVQDVLKGPTAPGQTAPQMPPTPMGRMADVRELPEIPEMPAPTFAPIAPDPSFEQPQTIAAQPSEQELYPSYTYQPIDLPEPLDGEPDSPLQPVEHRPALQPDDEPLPPLVAELLTEGIDPAKAIIYADIIAPRHNYF